MWLPVMDGANKAFLSTPSVRRATGRAVAADGAGTDFYPRPPCGGRLFAYESIENIIDISIHALRAEGDSFTWYRDLKIKEISIHALRAEGDCSA